MNPDKELKAFMESLKDGEEKAFLDYMEEKTGAGASEDQACIEYAAGKGYRITAEELAGLQGKVLLTAEDMEAVSGGTCFSAGTPDQQRVWNCPAKCRNAYRTGNEKEESFFIFWTRHMKEYYCPDCNSHWWVHED